MDKNIASKKMVLNLSKNVPKFALELMRELTDHIPYRPARKALRFAMEFLKPYVMNLGFRITKNGNHQIEVLVPHRRRNCDETGQISEGILCLAAVFAFKKLWTKGRSSEEEEILVKQISFQRVIPFKGDLRLRLELPEMTRETLWAELQKSKVTHEDFTVPVLCPNQIVAQIEMQIEIRSVEVEKLSESGEA